MNTYIQDKLDTFEQFLMDKCPSHTNNSPEGFEKWLENLDIDELMDYAMNYRNQSLTDYHNHIVEKVKNELGDFAHTKYAGCTREGGKDYYWYENEVVYIVDEYFESLQDTNPKE